MDTLKEKFSMKADDSFTVESALGKIRKALTDRKKCKCSPYSLFVIDAEKDLNMSMLKHLSTKVTEIYTQYADAPKIKIVVLVSRTTPSESLEKLRKECASIKL